MFGNTTKLVDTIETQAVTIATQADAIDKLATQQSQTKEELLKITRDNEKLNGRISKIKEFLDNVGISLDAIEHGLWPTKASALLKISIDEANFEQRVGDTAKDTKEQIIMAARHLAPKAAA